MPGMCSFCALIEKEGERESQREGERVNCACHCWHQVAAWLCCGHKDKEVQERIDKVEDDLSPVAEAEVNEKGKMKDVFHKWWVWLVLHSMKLRE